MPSFQCNIFLSIFFLLLFFSIFVLKLFLELLLSISHRSLNIRIFHIPNAFVRLKCLWGRRIKENTQWQGCMVELVPKNDAFKREKSPQLQLSGQNNTYYVRLYVVAIQWKNGHYNEKVLNQDVLETTLAVFLKARRTFPNAIKKNTNPYSC